MSEKKVSGLAKIVDDLHRHHAFGDHPDKVKYKGQTYRLGDSMAEEKKGKKKLHAGHGYTHTNIEHHADGSHTVHHVHEDGSHKDVKGAVADHDGLMDHIMDHTSQPNPGEAEAEAGPAPAAAPAPAGPMPGGPAGPMGA